MMMKILVEGLTFLTAATSLMVAVESFITLQQPRHQGTTVTIITLKEQIISQERIWELENQFISNFISSLENDHDLDGVVDRHGHDSTLTTKHPTNKFYLNHEKHVHDNLLNEIEHSLETDPDLHNIVVGMETEKKKKMMMINKSFMEKESHVHDNLLNEIEHSVDNDSDLTF